MIKFLNFLITKIERHTKKEDKKKLYRDILDAIDAYDCKRGIYRYRYYRYFEFKIDSLS